jgi:hypothetical protein
MARMRAKFEVRSVEQLMADDGAVVSEHLHFSAVSGTDPFGANGESEDNTYARWTPYAELMMTITNPALFGVYREGDVVYGDFSEPGDDNA